MMAPPTVMMGARLKSQESPAHSPARRGRRNAMADVTVGITADQRHALEEMVQTYVPDFFDAEAAIGNRGSHRRNAVANVVAELTQNDLHHLEHMVRTYHPEMTTRHHTDDNDDDSSSGDGEDACSPNGPCPAYYERRRNALANPLANLDEETIRRIRSLHNCRHRSSNLGRI